MGWFVLLVLLTALGGVSWANAWTGYMPYHSRGSETYDYQQNKKVRTGEGLQFVEFSTAGRIAFGALAGVSFVAVLLVVEGLVNSLI
jgi:hypothetical protein